MPFPDSWLKILHDNVLLSHTLNPADQAKLRDAAWTLATRVTWEGCRGQEITDEVKVTIAAQAALLVIGLDGYVFDELKTILVYPGRFLAVDDEEDQASMRLGEAHQDGPVILSWWHSLWAGRRLGTVNVVVHEFAHKLAELGDPELGMPPFGKAADAKKWKKVMNAARRNLEEADFEGDQTLLDPYGAESMAEFFAVASETFFLQPVEMRKELPGVYNLLAACYRQDPARRPFPDELKVASEIAEVEYAQQGIRECTAALKLRSGFIEALYERAGHYETLGDLDKALEDWREVERLGDDDERIDALYEQVAILENLGRLDEAEAAEARAEELRSDPGGGGWV